MFRRKLWIVRRSENYSEGTRVNLERAVTPTTRLGGHIVQGHVDGCGIFLGATESGEFWTVSIGYPDRIKTVFGF